MPSLLKSVSPCPNLAGLYSAPENPSALDTRIANDSSHFNAPVKLREALSLPCAQGEDSLATSMFQQQPSSGYKVQLFAPQHKTAPGYNVSLHAGVVRHMLAVWVTYAVCVRRTAPGKEGGRGELFLTLNLVSPSPY